MALKRTTQRTQAALEPKQTPQDNGNEHSEINLRPKKLNEYVGQRKLKEHLLIHMEAARKRKEPMGHTLFYGPPGLGKTTLAHIMAAEMGAQIRITSGPAIEKAGDVASLLTNLQHGDILFIDEIHRLRPAVEEMLYSAMEDCVLDIMIGKGPSARSVRLTLQPFTLVGATTKVGAVSAPLRDRFLQQFKLAFYDAEEMGEIIKRSATLLEISMEDAATILLAGASRFTPRIANRLIRSVRDFAQVKGDGNVTTDSVEETLTSLDIDREGLDAMDRNLLEAIIDSFGGGPVGLSTLAAVLAEEQETVEDVYEPFLMQQGYLNRTPKGRVVTKKAYEKLGRNLPEGEVPTLF